MCAAASGSQLLGPNAPLLLSSACQYQYQCQCQSRGDTVLMAKRERVIHIHLTACAYCFSAADIRISSEPACLRAPAAHLICSLAPEEVRLLVKPRYTLARTERRKAGSRCSAGVPSVTGSSDNRHDSCARQDVGEVTES